jgi:hypothetical protein
MKNSEVINRIIRKINSREVMPKYWFRRNHEGYQVVSAVNNVIGLYLSNELEDFLIDRIEAELKKVSQKDDTFEYIKLAQELSIELYKYLSQIELEVEKKSIKNLNLLVLRCKDIDKSREFYEKLSFCFIEEQHGKGPIHYSTMIGSLVLELYPLGKSNIDNVRLGFTIDNKKILENENIEIVSEYSFNDVMTYIVVDPDGRKVEIQIVE